MSIRIRKVLRRPIGVLSMTCALACGGGQQEPKEPEAAPAEESPEPPAATEAAPEGSAAPAETAAGTKEAAPAEQPLRTPKDIIGAPGVLFAFSFAASEAHDKSEEECDKKAGDDPQKKAECMSKASEKFEADAVAFQKDDEEKWWWLTLKRKGGSMTNLHKIEFDFGEEKDKSITLKPKGRDKGSKPMGNIPKELVIEVPTESQIAIVDPKLGRMVYEAKLGLLGEAKK